MKELPGLSDGNIFGWGYTPLTIDLQMQTRSSSEISNLREALVQTTDVVVYKNTMAKKVLFDSKNRANGVIVDSGGLTYQINATHEVIISAVVVRTCRASCSGAILLNVLTAFSFDLPNY